MYDKPKHFPWGLLAAVYVLTIAKARKAGKRDVEKG
jgi:hypothetical protein